LIEHAIWVWQITIAGQIAAGSLKMPKRGAFKGVYSYVEKAIVDYGFARDYVFKQARAQVMKASGGNYPAPLTILDTLKKNVAGKSLAKAKGYDAEADAFADLALTPESEGLQAVFFGSTALKKNPFKGASKVERIGVLGAGLMGAGIAEVSINKGLTAVLKDVNAKGLAVGETNIHKSFAKKVQKKRMTSHKRDETLSRLIGVTDEDDFWRPHINKCDVVIEAVFEDLGLKHRIVKQLEEVCKPSAIIATNTSGLPVAKIAEAAERPENVVGMHYFSPVTAMPLVEIIPHEGTAEEVTATAVALALKQGKFPVVVKDVAGFFVNRCLGPYIDESMVLAFEVDDFLQLDRAMKKFGMPVGPMTLADEVGVEVAFHLHTNLQEDLGVRMSGANVAAMKAILAAGIRGKRFGSGFLSYPGKKPTGLAAMNPFATKEKVKMNPVAVEAMKPFRMPAKVTDEDIETRISARFINEAAYCLQDGVVRNPTDGDMACIFGVGFPPFTGGPFRYLDRVGSAKYVDALSRLADKYGPRFAPAPILADMARSGAKFYK
jgi:enoyl-CoA hydratase/long-chain 3-hydroxyacyl-CoA dehydrogenase